MQPRHALEKQSFNRCTSISIPKKRPGHTNLKKLLKKMHSSRSECLVPCYGDQQIAEAERHELEVGSAENGQRVGSMLAGGRRCIRAVRSVC